METIEVRGIEFDAAGDAIQHANAKRAEFGGTGVAVLFNGKHLLVATADAERMAAVGCEFAYLGEVEMTGGERRIVTIPVN